MSIKGDFISFTYNGVHSTELGIVRTSSSNRYNDQLVPTSQDKTVPVPGGNGTYFFGSYYTQRAITLDIAYDEVTEETLRRMRKVFEANTVHELIFDDEPYKVYYAKVTGQPQLKYIPFQNYDSELLNGTPRIYKGEGTINFTCYDPFAHCLWNRKYLTQWNANVYDEVSINKIIFNANKTLYYYKVGNVYIHCTDDSVFDSSKVYYTHRTVPSWYKYENKNEWNLSAHLLSTWNDYDNYTRNIPTQYRLYNPGDVEADFELIIPFGDCQNITSLTLSNTNTGYSESLYLDFQSTSKTTPDTGESVHVSFNSKTNLLEEMIRDDSTGIYRKTGKLYNEALQTTVWFKIPVMETYYDSINNTWAPTEEWLLTIVLKQGQTISARPTLMYDYLYY